GPEAMVMAVRRPDGRIVVKDSTWIPLVKRIPVLRWPFLRGAAVMVEAMINGMQALSYSADVAAAGEEEAKRKAEAERTTAETEAETETETETESENENETEAESETETKGGLSNASIALTMLIAFGMGIGLFIYLPHFGSGVLLNLVSGDPLMADPDLGRPLFHLFTGLIKVSVFVGYILLITSMRDIRRVFQYHGAEHKSIYVWEAGEELTVDNARRHSRLHPRCGTAFLAFVILVAIALFAGVFPLLPFLDDLQGWQRFAAGASIKIPLMFPIAGISYEFIRWAGKFRKNPVLRVLSWPGLLMQRLTTREPDDDQLEVALVSLIRALQREGDLEAPAYPGDPLLPVPQLQG
ncbi:MAG: DUF1385 domain-containing protein, partial [Myxococcota bacterium]|nr:DUF1385 domain-containing protein [Myxococcota bacterium]